MKKIGLLALSFGLVACDFESTPKCWDEGLRKGLLGGVTYSVMKNGQKVKYRAISVDEMIEMFEEKPHKNTRFCNVVITFSDGIQRSFAFRTAYGKTQNGKEAKIMDLEEF